MPDFSVWPKTLVKNCQNIFDTFETWCYEERFTLVTSQSICHAQKEHKR